MRGRRRECRSVASCWLPALRSLTTQSTTRAPLSRSSPTVTSFTVPTRHADPEGITVGPDGALWFTESGASQVGRLFPPSSSDPSPAVTEFPSSARATSITSDTSNSLWFLTPGGASGQIGRARVNKRQPPSFTWYNPPFVVAGDITFSSVRRSLFFSVDRSSKSSASTISTNAIGKMKLPTASSPSPAFAMFPVPNPSAQIVGIAALPDGSVWATECNLDRVVRFSKRNQIREFRLPKGSGPTHLTFGPDGNLWIIEAKTQQVAQFSTSGVLLKQYRLTVPPSGIARGADGALWLSAFDKYGAVVRLTPNGGIAYFKEDIWKVAGITAGPDGAIWITQWSNPKHPRWLQRISRLQ